MLNVRMKISEKQAKKLIFDLVKYSDHSNRSLTDGLKNKTIEQWFEQNKYPFKRLVSDTRDWEYVVPFVENTMDSKVYISGAGIINVSDYQGEFESALEYRNTAINNADIEAYHACIAKLFVSLASYLSFKAECYNAENEDKLEDAQGSPVSLEEKIKLWIPILSGGKELDSSKKSWDLFQAQLAQYNEDAINPTFLAQDLSATQLAEKVNDLRGGIINIMYELHVLLSDEIKSQLVRAVYFPDVYVSEVA
ncbi:hypothetical protein AKG98_318 [Moritella sp. JT01]|uniref:hypothetical protein n=1 Tax=Moritella sp. JT01 TaxID=756698 RepID=UPI00079848E0|nr:hypothetical protein [Moritella sp. JT01]KXO14242.1 hypothetical protein AKG98_318 [Moritella sp. JT01]